MEKVSVGIWSFGMGTDRYVAEGYKPYINFSERLDRISRIEGIRGVEITYPNDVDFENVRNVQSEIEAHGLKISALGIENVCDAEWQFGSFTAEDPERRKKTIQLTKDGMALATELGVDVINLWLGQDGFDYVFQSDYQDSWKRLVDGLQQCADYCPGIKIGLEYKTSEPKMHCIVGNGGKALALAQATGKDNVGITLDVGHAFNARENPAEIASVLLAENRLFHLHLNDNYGWTDDDMPIGTVHLPQYVELFYWLEKQDYPGWYSLDIYPYRDDAVEACRASIEFIEKCRALIQDTSFEKEMLSKRSEAPGKMINWLINRIMK